MGIPLWKIAITYLLNLK
ncbi:hypothetical protein EYZ11_012693 [Aspergillus tanneri]|uniref:Uncharacterized protein n=1 Tax=Aspergillus tanneri TaxID=1220188 RepID=A0A4S3J042_9EURO|nr:hypothetical protein EYZ11_012693 [Aspergillus tanneri]